MLFARLVILLFLVNAQIHAQVTFNKILYPGQGIEAGDNVIELTDGYIICGGGFLSAFDGWSGILLIKTDLNGNELWRKDHGKIGYVWNNGNPGSMVASLQGGFAVAGYFTDTNSTNRSAALFKFDDDGDFEWMKTFGGPRDDYFSRCKQLPNSDYIMIGTTQNFGDVDGSMYVVKTDSLGNFLWQKTYGGSLEELGASIDFTLDSQLILGGGTASFGDEFFNNYLLKINFNGDTLWTATPAAPKNTCGAKVISSKSGGYIIGSCADTLNNVEWLVNYIQSIDSTGALRWRYYLKAEMVSAISDKGLKSVHRQFVELEDESIIIVGEEYYTIDSFSQYGWMIKLDKNGNRLWERIYTYSSDGGISLSAVKQTTDEGFICVGTGYEDGHSNSSCWLLKLDSLGCLSENDCGLPTGVQEPILTVESANIQIIPNPAHEQAIVSIKASHFPGKEVSIQFSDLTGKMMQVGQVSLNTYGYGEYRLERKDVPDGIYIITITSGNQLVGRGKIVFQ